MDDATGSLIDAPALPGFAQGSSSAASPAYRVLARKYRPQAFADLIGQEAMVRTLANAFEANRIPQAWMLTGVRGVGKTTTARILARGLNYSGDDGRSGAPAIAMPTLGPHCTAIMESRHIDVLEMDAASHTGIDDVRQIIDGVRYAPVSARYKVYIVDEVHMLSEKAFNAFLKTLEEPPPHVKFVFATTEIRKVPVTILSRCQRFDLRRVEADALVAHLARICGQEGVSAEAEALAAIARAAEGSVRDALSLLDQAIAHGGGTVAAAAVREMLGLADRARVIDLFEAVMRGDVPGAFAELRAQHAAGADPAVMLSDLAAFTHLVTRLKLVPETGRDPALSEAERVRGQAFAEGIPVRALSRAWQILLKAVPEVEAAARPLPAAEMALVRLAYAADLPTPDEVLRGLKGAPPQAGQPQPAPAPGAQESRAPEARAPLIQAAPIASPATALQLAPAPQATSARPTTLAPPATLAPPPWVASSAAAQAAMAQPAPIRAQGAQAAPRLVPAPRPEATRPEVTRPEPARSRPAEPIAGPRVERLEDVVALAAQHRDIVLQYALEHQVHLVRLDEGRIEFRPGEGARETLAGDIGKRLEEWTGRRWMVAVSQEPGAPTLVGARREAVEETRRGAASHPLVKAVLTRFPGAEIVNVRDRAAEEEAKAPETGILGAADAAADDETEADDDL